jgi:2-phospho-L-lactate guanylyltransferase
MTVAILPIRALHDGKRRLQLVLSPQERTALVHVMLLRVVRAVHASRCVEQVVVVSPDAAVLAAVQEQDVWLAQQPDQGLNSGLEYARSIVRAELPQAALLIVLPDLPLLQPMDIAGIVEAGADDTIVVAPDRHEYGTNALWLPPGAMLPFSFGANSLQQHRAAAAKLGLSVHSYAAVGTAFDLDTAEDLELVRLPIGR